MLLGDFNINWNSNSREKQLIQQSLISTGLYQVITGSSVVSYHGNESLIDHNYVNCDLKVKTSKILTCERSISDHYATLLMLDRIKPLKPKTSTHQNQKFQEIKPLVIL